MASTTWNTTYAEPMTPMTNRQVAALAAACYCNGRGVDTLEHMFKKFLKWLEAGDGEQGPTL